MGRESQCAETTQPTADLMHIEQYICIEAKLDARMSN